MLTEKEKQSQAWSEQTKEHGKVMQSELQTLNPALFNHNSYTVSIHGDTLGQNQYEACVNILSQLPNYGSDV